MGEWSSRALPHPIPLKPNQLFRLFYLFVLQIRFTLKKFLDKSSLAAYIYIQPLHERIQVPRKEGGDGLGGSSQKGGFPFTKLSSPTCQTTQCDP